VHLEDLHCLLAHFPGLICDYLASKIIIIIIIIIKFIFYFLLAIILFCVFTYKCYL
jgi:hypothetical protein